MLQTIRDRLVGWVLWLVLGPIIVTFAFWGVQSFREFGGDPVVARVGGWLDGRIGGERITQSQVKRAYEQRYRQMQRLMGDNFRPDQIDPKQFEQILLDDLIKQITLHQYTQKEGY